MDGYLSNFFDHWGQAVSLAAAGGVWLGLSAMGRVVGARDRFPEAAPLYGWALASFVFTAVGVFTDVPFTPVAVAFAALAAGAGLWLVWRGDSPLPPGTLRIAALALPLLVLVSAMVGSQWDEFSDWLISPRQILILDTFPDDSNKSWGGSLAAYPYGWHLITYLASRLAGGLLENAGALTNVFLLLTFGLVVVRLVQDGLGRPPSPKDAGWGLLALGGLSTTLLNPTFAQKVVLTSYADAATAVCIGFGGVMGWAMLDALARRDGAAARALAIRIGLVMLVLVNLKQATVVLFVLVVGAIVLAGLRDPAVGNRDLMRTLPAMVVPGIVIYLIWRYYLATELTGAEMHIQPLDEWLFALIPQIVWNMIVVFSKKGAYFALMIAATAFAVRGFLRPRSAFDRLAVITGAMFLGYNGFLLFVFVTTFGKFDALRVASLWRYNMHLGPLGVAFAAYGLAILWRTRLAGRFEARRLAWLPVALMLAAPFVFAHKLRFDRQPWVPFFRAVGADVAGLIGDDQRLFIVDPKGSGESGVITRYEIGGSTAFMGYLSVFHNADAKYFRRIFFERGYTHLLVHSATPPLLAATGMKFEDGVSYLLESDGRGGWKTVRTWKRKAR